MLRGEYSPERRWSTGLTMMTQPVQRGPHVLVTREEQFDAIDQRVVFESSNPYADRPRLAGDKAAPSPSGMLTTIDDDRLHERNCQFCHPVRRALRKLSGWTSVGSGR